MDCETSRGERLRALSQPVCIEELNDGAVRAVEPGGELLLDLKEAGQMLTSVWQQRMGQEKRVHALLFGIVRGERLAVRGIPA